MEIDPKVEQAYRKLAEASKLTEKLTEAELDELLDHAFAWLHPQTEVAMDRADKLQLELDAIAAELDEFAPYNTGLSLPESVSLAMTTLRGELAKFQAKYGKV